jgi:hypothetical protein
MPTGVSCPTASLGQSVCEPARRSRVLIGRLKHLRGAGAEAEFAEAAAAVLAETAVAAAEQQAPANHAHLLNLVPSTVHRVLTRFGLARLAHLDRATARPIRRYERGGPGELVHVDIKKLGNIPDGCGHKVLGRPVGRKNRTQAGYGGHLPAEGWGTTCTPPSTTTPASPTARSSPTRRRRPPPRSGPGPRHSSSLPGSPWNGS